MTVALRGLFQLVTPFPLLAPGVSSSVLECEDPPITKDIAFRTRHQGYGPALTKRSTLDWHFIWAMGRFPGGTWCNFSVRRFVRMDTQLCQYFRNIWRCDELLFWRYWGIFASSSIPSLACLCYTPHIGTFYVKIGLYKFQKTTQRHIIGIRKVRKHWPLSVERSYMTGTQLPQTQRVGGITQKTLHTLYPVSSGKLWYLQRIRPYGFFRVAQFQWFVNQSYPRIYHRLGRR